MEKSYLKLNAKRRLIKNCFKCFMVSVFPFTSIILLSVLNYLLLISLNFIRFNEHLMPYEGFIRSSIMTANIILSIFIWKSLQLSVDSYFLLKALGKKVTFIKAVKCVTFRQCITFFIVSIIRFFLSISWLAVYLSPCVVVSVLLVYSYRNENNGFNINLTLFVSSVLLLIIGVSFLYVTLKRYAMCTSVIITDEEKNPFNVIVKSINLMEGRSIRYALYSLSYFGWFFSCFLIIPLVYAVPYSIMGKWCFKNSLGLSEMVKHKKEKPIIFYFVKRVQN